MSQKRKRLLPAAILAAVRSSSFHLEMRKSTRGAVMLVDGVVGISDFNDEMIVVLSHSGRLTVRGNSLALTSLENRTVEIFGKIEEVTLGYGKA